MQLLQAPGGFGLNQRILMILHYSTRTQERRPRHTNRRRVSLQLWSDGRDQRGKNLPYALMNI